MCTDDEPLERAYPQINTLEVDGISETGATFHAEIINQKNLDIVEYGFIWSIYNNPNFYQSEKVVISEPFDQGNFIANIRSTLLKDVVYYVKAFVRTEKLIIYGKQVTFTSLGSGPPSIADFLPKTGAWGDTITIKGANFSYNNDSNEVYFNDKKAEVLKSTDSILTCVVPNTELKSFPITVDIVGNKVISNEFFTLLSPEVTTISPLHATFRDTLTITGNNFNKLSKNNEVRFGNVSVPIIYANEHMLKITVPDELENSTEKIIVSSNFQPANFNEMFTLIPPEIILGPTAINIDQTFDIKVKYFNPQSEKNKFTIEGYEVNTLNYSDSTFSIKAPWKPFPRRKAIIKVQVLDLVAEYEVDILDKWLMVSDELPFAYYSSFNQAVTANNSAYIIAMDKDYTDENYYLWKLNSVDFTWQKYSLPFDIDFYGGGGVLTSSDNLLLLYVSNHQNDFWSYNTITSTWTKKSSFIGPRRSGATGFTIDGNVYIGLGRDYEPYIPISYQDFYKYNPNTDQWSKISDIPFDIYDGSRRQNAVSFVINRIGYFTSGALSTGDTDSWAYNPDSDQWSRIADSPYAFENGDAAFVLNGLGYITCSGYSAVETWTYDPASDKWEKSYDIGIIPRGNHFAFYLNGKAYSGGGRIYGGGSSGFDMYEFVP